MNTEVKNNNTKILEKTRLNKAFLNYDNIINKNLPYKFAYIDEWVLKKSKLLLKETEPSKKIEYRTYKRGTIVKVDFGVGLGSEMSQVHFAIVLNNHDNPKNNVLTVLPLTSKENKYNLDLGNLVFKKMVDQAKEEVALIGKSEEMYKLKISDEANVKLTKLITLMSYYKTSAKNTYACCNLVTTISKTRILKPINEYDIIGKTRCSKEIMNLIDDKLNETFIKKQK